MEHIEGAHLTEPKREKVTRAAGLGGSAVEALAGLAAVVLAILGLAGMAIIPFASIAMIATGAALLFEAAAVASRKTHGFGFEDEVESAGVKSAVGADSIAGIGAITLGILSLIGLDPATLLPVGAIILGAGLLLSAGGPASEREGSSYGRAGEVVRESLAASSGVHVLVGAGAVVLGIIGVLGSAPVLMTLIALLSIGAAQLLTGAALGGRMTNMLRHGF